MTWDKRKKTLMLSIILSAFGPFITLAAVFMSTSSTQLADFIRRTIELFVLVMAFIIYEKLAHPSLSEQKKTQYKTIMRLSLLIILSLTTISLLGLVLYNLTTQALPEGTIWLGFSVAVLGIGFNGAFWWRYSRFDQASPHTVMHSQKKLYQAKTLVDINVTIALGAYGLFGASQVIFWLDIVGTLVVALYIVWRVFNTFIELKQ